VITLSDRYAKWLVAIFLLFALPVLAVDLWPRRRDDCRNPDLLFVTSLIEGSKPLGESKRAFSRDVVQWSKGELVRASPLDPPIRFQIVRSFDTRALYTTPTYLVEGTLDAELHEVEHVRTAAGPLPIHVAIDHTRSPSRFAAWAFVFDGRAVESPFLTILASAPRQLIGGSLPLTVLIVDGISLRHDVASATDTAKRWLASAWVQIATVCR
jgi:hypothetical protein